MDSQLRTELEEDRSRLILAYLESENGEDQDLLAVIELLLGMENKMPNAQVSTTWVTAVNRLIGEVQSLAEAARDGREVPEWLQERLTAIEKLLELC